MKCIGWLWRARAILSSNCFETLSAVVVSYAMTARSSAIVEAQPAVHGHESGDQGDTAAPCTGPLAQGLMGHDVARVVER